MRYFFEASYHGGRYAGWQRQPNDPSVQQTLEEAFTLILREEIKITGCGRTDTGVHARQYYFHLDTETEFTGTLMYRFNKYLPPDIGLRSVHPVSGDAHARYSAVRRTYQYVLSPVKNPFTLDTALWYPQYEQLDWETMNEMARVLHDYGEFRSFCKEGSDTTHYLCQIDLAQWDVSADHAVFTIRANRFLRGMVRLIVGASLEIGHGKLAIDEVRLALDEQRPVPRAVSAPPHGLSLVRVEYPEGLLERKVE
jgi:tRNA pseudouridine38-40 synthase